MNWTLIIVVAAIALALLLYLIRQNQKDEKSFERSELDDRKPLGETEPEDQTEN